MDATARGRHRRRLAAALLALGGVAPGAAPADEPRPFPLAAPTPTAPPLLEIYYGTTRVSPAPRPAAPPRPVVAAEPVAPVAAKGPPAYHEPARPGEALVGAIQAVRDGTASVSVAAVNLLGRVGARLMSPPEPRQVVLAAHAAPAATAPPANTFPPPYLPARCLLPTPWLTTEPAEKPPPVAAPAVPVPAPPTVVVIREPAADPRPAEPARGLTVGVESAAAVGLGAIGVVFGLASWVRGGRRPSAVPAPPAVTVVPPPGPPDGGVRLLGQYNAGPPPETAEKFDIGPSYGDQVQQTRRTEAANNQAAVEFILSQNLALLAAMNPATAADPADAPPAA